MANKWYQEQDKIYGIDYNLFPRDIKLCGGGDFFQRGPLVDCEHNKYIACIGSAHTFGRFSKNPYPALLKKALGIDVLNLGYGGAGPKFFLQNKGFLELINNSALAIVQVMSARSVSTALWESDYGATWGRRKSDGVSMLSSNFIWEILYDAQKIRQYVKETRDNYVKDFIELLNKIKPPTVLFWVSERPPGYVEKYPDRKKTPELKLCLGQANPYEWKSKDSAINTDREKVLGKFPHLVNSAMIEKIKPYATEYVEYIASIFMPQILFAKNRGFQINRYYPTPGAHRRVAKALKAPCVRLLDKASNSAAKINLRKKRILVISPFPTHPQNAGNRTRAYNMLMTLKKFGHEIHFVWDENNASKRHISKKADKKSMSQAWDKAYCTCPGFWSLGKFRELIINKGGKMLKRCCPFLYNSLKPYFPDKTSVFDSFNADKGDAPPAAEKKRISRLDKLVKKLCRENNYDIALVEYVFMSRVLKWFSKTTIKIIDTHDVFTDRDNELKKYGINNSFFSTNAEAEAVGLDRADVVIAIQEQEREFFSKLTEKRIITIGHLVAVHKPVVKKNLSNTILFVGADNETNVHAIEFFIKEALPLIRDRIPDAKLQIAGKVSDSIRGAGCLKLGEIADISSAYMQTDIVINPMMAGTGLKIKSIEALGHGKPLVMTTHASLGLQQYAGKAFLVADSQKAFAECVVRILTDKDLYYDLCEKAYECAKEYRISSERTLEEVFNHER